MRRQRDTHAAVIDRVGSPLDQFELSQPVHQFHRAVGTDQQCLSKVADDQRLGARGSFDRQKRLVLLRGQSGLPCRLLAKRHELAARHGERRPGLVIGFGQARRGSSGMLRMSW